MSGAAAASAEVSGDERPGSPPRRRTAISVAIVVAVVVGALVVLLATSPGGGERTDRSVLIGKLAPPITATDTGGAAFDLDAYRGTWVLVNFFATWCGPCKVEHPELVEFAARHAATKDASVVSVSFNDKPDDVRAFFERNGGDWPVIAEGNAQIALDYGVVKLPESYLISPTGLVVQKFVGGIRADDVDAVISEVGK